MNDSHSARERTVRPFNRFDWSHRLADYVEASVEAILKAWGRAVENDQRTSTASRLTRNEFVDSIPVTLGLLVEQLRKGETHSREGTADGNPDADLTQREESSLAHKHGLHRWQEGYSIEELTIEWGHLHLCLVKIYNDFEAEHPDADPYQLNLARLTLAQLMNGGFTQSVAEYNRLQQTEAQEIVESLSQALRQVSELDRQRGELLREAVHDLRGSLTATQAATHLVQLGAKKDISGLGPILDILQRSTVSLHDMLTQLLDLARLEAGQETLELQPTDSAKVLQEIRDEIEPLAAAKGLTLSYFGPDQFPVESDPIKLRRITQNLLLNAIKYTQKGGVTLSCCEAGNDNWGLIVEDTGPGFSSSPQEGLPTGANHGEGVGLAIVKRLCTLLGAQFKIDSEQGQGTKISITWPKQYSEARSAAVS